MGGGGVSLELTCFCRTLEILFFEVDITQEVPRFCFFGSVSRSSPDGGDLLMLYFLASFVPVPFQQIFSRLLLLILMGADLKNTRAPLHPARFEPLSRYGPNVRSGMEKHGKPPAEEQMVKSVWFRQQVKA